MLNTNIKQRQRIGIDARFYGPLGKGLGRYVQELVDNLIKINEENKGEYEYIIFLSPDNFEYFNSNSSFVEKKLLSLKWYSWREQVFFPWIIKKSRLDLMHFPHFNVPILCPVPFVVTIHDLILTRFPSRRASMLPATLYWLKQLAYRLVIKKALKNSKQIITVSNFTKEDIVTKFKTNQSKIKVIYEGVAKLSSATDNHFDSNEVKLVLEGYRVKAPFILYVGNAYPHKNLESLLPLFQKISLDYPDLSLVMVGKEDYFYKRLKEQAMIINNESVGRNGDLFIFPGYVPDAHLSCFYQGALFYIFPSLYEGFGLPPLEAMSFSCPVMSSNQASLPEIIGDAALYFNPYEEQDILDKIRVMINDEKVRGDLVLKGLTNVKRFSWSDCAKNTLAIYKSVLQDK